MHLRIIKVNQTAFGLYVTSEQDASGRKRPAPPQVLAGDPVNFDRICETLMPARVPYDSFILSFEEPYAQVGPTVAGLAWRGLEDILFAGLDREDFIRCTVLHERAHGCDIHHAVGRTNLRTGQTVEFYNMSRPDAELFARFASAFSIRHGVTDPNDPRTVNLRGQAPSGLAATDRRIWEHFDETAAAYYQAGDATNRDELVLAFCRDSHPARTQSKTSITIQHEAKSYIFRGPKFSAGFQFELSSYPPVLDPRGRLDGLREPRGNPAYLARVEDDFARLTDERRDHQQRNYQHAEMSWRPVAKGRRISSRKRKEMRSAELRVRFAPWRNFDHERSNRSAQPVPQSVTAPAVAGELTINVVNDVSGRRGHQSPRLESLPTNLPAGPVHQQSRVLGPVLGPNRFAPHLNGARDGSQLGRDGLHLVRPQPRRAQPATAHTPDETLSVILPRTYHDDASQTNQPKSCRRFRHRNLGLNFVRKIYDQIYRTVRNGSDRLAALFVRATAIISDCRRNIQQSGHALGACLAEIGAARRRVGEELSFAPIIGKSARGYETVLLRDAAEGTRAQHGDVGSQESRQAGADLRGDFKRVTDRLAAVNAALSPKIRSEDQSITLNQTVLPAGPELR